MNESVSLKDSLLGIYEQLTDFVITFAPRLVTAIVLLLIGLVIAKVIERLVRGALARVRLDSFLERFGITDLLRNIGMKEQISRALAGLVYYVLVILFLQAAAEAVGLTVVTSAITSFFRYLPNLVAAVLILLLGNVVAKLAQTAVTQSGKESGVEYAASLGRAVAAAILFVVAIMAIAQLGIDTAMIRIVVVAALAGSALAFGISFGLGTREVTRNLVAGFYARKLYRVGEPIEVQDETGVLAAITPTKTLLDRDGRLVAIANHELMERPVRQ